mmetsp:Transcript_38069/g.45997  ORF Transcript_38069/g.45997 Transcript_38069/m.45997 type:complete len:1181 (-) Transcript_38069:92-3634(-)
MGQHKTADKGISKKKRALLKDVIEEVCGAEQEDTLSKEKKLDRWAMKVLEIFILKNDSELDDAGFKEMEDCFNACDERLSEIDRKEEFGVVEDFVLAEQRRGRSRRDKACAFQATHELKMAAEVAEIKEFRVQSKTNDSHQKLQEKIADSERAYVNRKMVCAKASQVASADCRVQFARVRSFFEKLHLARKANLDKQHMRALKLLAIKHRLRNTDSRVIALEQQTASRVYNKKMNDINEYHMAQNLEESLYLDKMMDLLYSVQGAKEVAAEEMFKLQVDDLKKQRKENERRDSEMDKLRQESALEMAQMVAYYVKDDNDNMEDDGVGSDKVAATERRKDFIASPGKVVLAVSELYDTVLWSVATSKLGISTTGSSLYSSSEFGSDVLDDDDTNADESITDGFYDMTSPDSLDTDQDATAIGQFSETGSAQSGSTANANDEEHEFSMMGQMHVKKFNKELRMKDNALIKKHKCEERLEKRKYRTAAKALRRKHQVIVNNLLAVCVTERNELRDAISQRMNALAKRQEMHTINLRESVEKDVRAMQEAWAEHKRLEDAEKSSFAKAQALISAQVFHEVRNALSSVISMSEITASLKKDSTISPAAVMSSVDEMLDQIKEVVHYALNMLNNILDVSKMNTGTYDVDKKIFDLQDLVSRATKMQQVKAKLRNVKMSFIPSPNPQIAYSDSDIVVRIVTNFISNAVKFTTCGSVQPFVCPVQMILPDTNDSIDSPNKSGKTSFEQMKLDVSREVPSDACDTDDESTLTIDSSSNVADKSEFDHLKTKTMIVGVADTGPGLSRSLLDLAEAGLSNADSTSMVSGAKNSGFGLHLAHQLAKALGTRVHLSSLEQCKNFLNEDTLNAMMEHQRSHVDEGMQKKNMAIEKEGDLKVANRGTKGSNVPGKGTVLFITVPVFADRVSAQKALEKIKEQDIVLLEGNESSSKEIISRHVFSPLPAPNSPRGSFRILVADDVAMLRKGLVHAFVDIFSQFPNCPLTICTACTAEDALRAIASEPFDLMISDNQFATPTTLTALSPEEEKRDRPHVFLGAQTDSSVPMRQNIKNFFTTERFTIREGDGTLSGLDALVQIEKASHSSPLPFPVLMLLSGHKIHLPNDCGIIIVQKPLKKSQFVPVMESHALRLVKLDQCVNVKKTKGSSIIMNKFGTQIFVDDRRAQDSSNTTSN